MNQEQLDAIKVRCEVATAGPWKVTGTPHDGIMGAGGRMVCEEPSGDLFQIAADMVFIALARTDVPALIAEVERLKRLDTAVGKLVNDPATVQWMEMREGPDEIIAELEAAWRDE